MKQVYDFSATTIHGEEISLEQFRGDLLLIVNTASRCGFTPQYEALQKLYTEYNSRGFTILGFPCNQFGAQEPGENESIEEGCRINYGVTFPLFQKCDVNGRSAHPLFTFLKSELPGVFSSGIKWNFTKFLIDPDGHPVRRFAPVTPPEHIRNYIEELLPR